MPEPDIASSREKAAKGQDVSILLKKKSYELLLVLKLPNCS